MKEDWAEVGEGVDSYSCGECRDFLLGRLQAGIKCITCNTVYHEACIQTSNEQERSVRRENTIQSDIISEEDFYLGELTRPEANEKLRNKEDGTFFVRFSKNHLRYILSRKGGEKGGDFAHFTIQQEEVQGTVYYWLKQGKADPSLLQVVKAHRQSHKLKFPFSEGLQFHQELRAGEPKEEDPYDMLETEQQEAEISAEDEANEEQERSWEEYSHGQMGKEEAERLLEGKKEGAFLIRINNNGYRLSRVPRNNGSRTAHFHIRQTTDNQEVPF